MTKYYAIPFAPEQPGGRAFPKTDVEESVRQHVQLLLMTMPGSFRFSPLFGSSLNKHHYHLPDQRKGERKLEDNLKDKLKENLRLLLAKYEPRLSLHDIEVTVKLPKPGEIAPHQKGGRVIFDITLIGTINGRKPFQHATSLLLQ